MNHRRDARDLTRRYTYGGCHSTGETAERRARRASYVFVRSLYARRSSIPAARPAIGYACRALTKIELPAAEWGRRRTEDGGSLSTSDEPPHIITCIFASHTVK